MDSFSVSYPEAEIDRAFDVLGDLAPKAISRAINRGVVSARTVMQRDIAADIGLKVGVVREQLRVTESRPDTLRARLSVSGSKIPLIDFNARATKRRGVTARLPAPGKGRYPRAFIARMKSGHLGVFQRKTLGAGSKRLPIYELHGPALPAVFSKLSPRAIAAGEESILKNLDSEIAYALSTIN